ncbi:MAG: nitroreductase/quinone reductase family protein [Candidatus Ranarchaeia archaeon]
MDQIEFPVKGSIVDKTFSGDKKILKSFKRMNKLVKFLYRVGIFPLFGMGRVFCLITMKGRKTGLERKVPLEYHRFHTGIVTVIASRGEKTHWLLNLEADNEAVLQLGFKKYKVRANIIKDTQEVFTHLDWYFENHTSLSKSFMGFDRKNPDHRVWIIDEQGEKEKGPAYEALVNLSNKLRVIQLIPD